MIAYPDADRKPALSIQSYNQIVHSYRFTNVLPQVYWDFMMQLEWLGILCSCLYKPLSYFS
jgi:hypothetical protein